MDLHISELFKIILFIIALGLSAFLSSSETAIFSLKAKDLLHIRYKNQKAYEIITNLLTNSESFITMLLILNEFTNIFASILFANIFQTLFGNKYLAISSGIVVFLLLLFGEITPKSLAVKNNVLISTIFARPLYILFKLSLPVVHIFTGIINLFKKIFFKNLQQENVLTITEKEFKNIVATSKNIFDSQEQQMIENVFKFEEKQIKDIMVPLRKVLMFEASTKIESFIKHLENIKYNRIPIYKQKRNDIVGILYIKDLIKRKWEYGIDNKETVAFIARKPAFISQNIKIDMAFKYMIKRKIHLLVVVDNHKTSIGVVSLQDIVEEIVGEIENDTN
ncbi:CBS domain-containing protein [Desulfurella amilsii]|uniref:CBS domain-containing protein n=1 Tax=Desulfurella amilsii TaxID=1562698 RepID=A0A1X4XUZ3_9BACT|nr:CNNM domain-containing protein [Desulfurella amilsii]OSS41351.1 CBS domain-containing protein [Desulfurella amilsii]